MMKNSLPMLSLSLIVITITNLFFITETSTPLPVITVYSTTTAPTVNGVKDAIWNDITAVSLYVYLNGDSGSTSFAVQSYFCHDSTYLYMAFEYADSQQDSNDFVGIMLDIDEDSTFSDGPTGEDYFDFPLAYYNGAAFSGVDEYHYQATDHVDGTSNTLGSGSFSSGNYFWEIRQPLASGDSNDVSLTIGDYILFKLRVKDANGNQAFKQVDAWTLDINATALPEFPLLNLLYIGALFAIITIFREKINLA